MLQGLASRLFGSTGCVKIDVYQRQSNNHQIGAIVMKRNSTQETLKTSRYFTMHICCALYSHVVQRKARRTVINFFTMSRQLLSYTTCSIQHVHEPPAALHAGGHCRHANFAQLRHVQLHSFRQGLPIWDMQQRIGTCTRLLCLSRCLIQWLP